MITKIGDIMKIPMEKIYFSEGDMKRSWQTSVSEANICYSNESNKPNIVVIVHPSNNIVRETFLANFTGVLEPICNEIFVITGNTSFSEGHNKKMHIIKMKGVDLDENESMLSWVLKQILIQLKASFNLFKIHKNIDIVVFYLAARSYLLPMLCAKLLKKKTAVTATGSASRTSRKMYSGMLFGVGGIFISYISGFLEKINFSLSDQIYVESESAIHFLGLNKYRNKISINGALYMDTKLFKIKKYLEDRRDLVGYIGRLSKEKGVMNFVKAIPLMRKEREDIDFLIGGGGLLHDKIKKVLEKSKTYDKVTLTGWIPHDKLPDYLNELKLLILPSYIEGVPGIVQEAMACGTVVLATPVGGVPDLIKDGETGFILENNSPECIEKNVIRALEHPNLDEIVKRARKLIEDEYAYEVMVRKCKYSLEELMTSK